MLTVQNVYKAFGGLQAVNGVSLTVPRGKIVGLIGPNGSGKSTLINMLSGMLAPDSGTIVFDGEDITAWDAADIYNGGLARGFQDASLFFQMTVLDNMLLPVKDHRGEQPWYAPLARLWRDDEHHHAQRAARILEQVSLRDYYDVPAAELSGGQMKLLEIARCVMSDPAMMLLDEPTAGVAPNLAYDIFQQIAALRDEREMTFLIVEHRLEILFDFVDYVYVMHLGDVFAEGTPAEIIANDDVREVYFGA